MLLRETNSIKAGCEAAPRRGLPRGVVLMDADYGADADLRTSIKPLGLELCRRHPVTHDRMGTWHRGRQRGGRAMGDRRSCCATMTSTNGLGQGACGRALPAFRHKSRNCGLARQTDQAWRDRFKESRGLPR
jgi:hypothetical protein